MSRRFLLWLALATFWSSPAVLVHAHDILVEPAPPGYEDASSAGLRAFDSGRYLEAKTHFEEAHRLWPTARSLRALGHCEYELRNYAVAVQLLEQSLASTVRPLSDTQRAESKELLQRARGYVANCKIRTVPANSQVSIDGVAVPDGGAGIVLLPVGPHVVQVQAEGYQPRRREFEIVGSVDQQLVVELSPVPAAFATSTGGPRVDPPLYQRWWVWTGVGGVVAAGIVTSLVLALRDPEVRPPTGGNSDIVITVRPAPPAVLP